MKMCESEDHAIALTCEVSHVTTTLISHKVIMKLFCKSEFPHKSVDFFVILVIVKDNLTDLWES